MFILAKFIKSTWPTKKLSEKYLGPYEVVGKPVPLSNIPNRVNPPPPPLEIDGNLEFEVAQILNSKFDHRRKEPLFYLIQWSGYEGTLDKYSWIPATDLKNAADLVSGYYSLYPKRPGPSHNSDYLPPNC